MNKLFNLLLIFPLFITGCRLKEIDNKIDNQSFDIFNMNIFSREGKKVLTINSPNSNYNKENNIFNLKETTIYLFKDDIKEYIIISDNAKLYNNNKLVELSGNVSVNKLPLKDDNIYANNFFWNIDKSEYLLTGNVIFDNQSITLSSNKASLNKSNNIIEFFKPVKYIIKNNSNDGSYEINSENAYYNIKTKSITFSSKEERVRSKIYF